MCPKSGRIWSKIFSPLVWICNGATHFWLLDRVSSSVGWYLPFYIWFPPIIEEIWRPGYPKNTLLKRDIHPVLWSVMISHHIFCSAWNLNILLGKSKTSLKIIDRNVKNPVRIATRGQILAEFESLRQKWQKVILLFFGVKIHIEINVEKRDILLNFKQCDFGQKIVWSAIKENCYSIPCIYDLKKKNSCMICVQPTELFFPLCNFFQHYISSYVGHFKVTQLHIFYQLWMSYR